MKTEKIVPEFFLGKTGLIPLTDDAASYFFKWFGDLRIFNFMGDLTTFPFTMENAVKYANAHKKDTKFIVGKNNGEWAIIGYMGLFIRERHNIGIFRIAIGEASYLGGGHAKRAIMLTFEYGFEKLNLYSIHLSVSGSNLTAIKLYESSGFRYCGEYTGARLENGKRSSEILMEYTAEMYNAKKRKNMRNIKSLANYIFWLVGLREILPKEVIYSVEVKENLEPLVEIKETSKLKLEKSGFGHKVRKSVYEMLINSSENLADDFTIVIVEGHRSRERQKLMWNNQLEIVKKENPNLPIEEIERITRLSVAQPKGEFGGHQTGGAVDVALGDKNGNQLFLGTKVQEFNSKTAMNARGLEEKEKELRKILADAMEKGGFVNYPGEWWHYCYGDRMWAAYSRKKYCEYGIAE
ncbi:MAG: GNAT family N-acetyltransferase [Candidatus Pacebacteria bacterium]|nr:GNAT family N-acetyltransferase [Candidatus Paceibacterota bacterium]